jgi:hypothetical protein
MEPNFPVTRPTIPYEREREREPLMFLIGAEHKAQ